MTKIKNAFQTVTAAFRRPVIETLNPPKPAVDEVGHLKSAVRMLGNALATASVDKELRQENEWQQYREMCHDMQEARSLSGSGPWKESDPNTLRSAVAVREGPEGINAAGASGDFEFMLQNADWRREINFSWLQFSRWGIQQIILICRLYYLKNPIIRRLIDICALYVFARGVEVSSPDKTANEELKSFFARNHTVLGQTALIEHEKRKYYDGNLFFVFFSDDVNSGETNIRLIDAVEVDEIITDPDDSDTPWYYKRSWSATVFDTATGAQSTATKKAWYPALGFDPVALKQPRPENIGADPVMWDNPVLHRKAGTVGKWKFGCPIAYPALDWAKAARKFLEACAAVKAALAQIAMTITTKGGQQALAGVKQQLETTVGTGNSGWWDQNPTAVNGSIFASGPGTTLAAFKSQGQGGDPEEVRQYKLMCCMPFGVPETFLSDVSTGNLATATSLDRPTELCFIAKQESWREDFVRIGTYVLQNSSKAANGKLRESHKGAKVVSIRESSRKIQRDGTWKYESSTTEALDVIEVQVTFPAIREGDIPQLVSAWVAAMTLGNTQGTVVGIDERAGVLGLGEVLGIEDNREIVEEMYPEGEYNPDREAQKEDAANKAAAAAKVAQDQMQQNNPDVKPGKEPV
jgi:hypothetical protein